VLESDFVLDSHDAAVAAGFDLDLHKLLAKILSHFTGRGKRFGKASDVSRFVIHRHKTGRVHYDLRFDESGTERSWSLLREPPLREREQRLAIEREGIPAEEATRKTVTEQAFGTGKVYSWDEGDASITRLTPDHLILEFRGNRIVGTYELRRMRWYPGNRWLLKKLT